MVEHAKSCTCPPCFAGHVERWNAIDSVPGSGERIETAVPNDWDIRSGPGNEPTPVTHEMLLATIAQRERELVACREQYEALSDRFNALQSMTPEQIAKYGPPRDLECECGRRQSEHWKGVECPNAAGEFSPRVELFAAYDFQPDCPHCGSTANHPSEARDVCPDYERFVADH